MLDEPSTFSISQKKDRKLEKLRKEVKELKDMDRILKMRMDYSMFKVLNLERQMNNWNQRICYLRSKPGNGRRGIKTLTCKT
jgi:hypothetical protein